MESKLSTYRVKYSKHHSIASIEQWVFQGKIQSFISFIEISRTEVFKSEIYTSWTIWKFKYN